MTFCDHIGNHANCNGFESSVEKYIELLKQNVEIPPWDIWIALNEYHMPPKQIEIWNKTFGEKQTKDEEIYTFLQQHDIEKMADLWKYPSVDELIPLCSFGTTNITSCNLFEESRVSYNGDKICYTFNYDGKRHINSVDPDLGLKFALDFRLPYSRSPDLSAFIVVHQNLQLPLIDEFHPTVIEIRPGVQTTTIGIEPKFLTKLTDSFVRLDKNQRKCSLENQLNCIMANGLNQSVAECACLPWFMWKKGQNVCLSEGLKCFRQVMGNINTSQCLPSCLYDEFSLITRKNDHQFEDAFGDEWAFYTSVKNPKYFTSGNNGNYGIKDRLALVRMNFNRHQVVVTTKDKRITASEMIGNIGGTFGVFLGLSFIGVLDFLLLALKKIQDILVAK